MTSNSPLTPRLRVTIIGPWSTSRWTLSGDAADRLWSAWHKLYWSLTKTGSIPVIEASLTIFVGNWRRVLGGSDNATDSESERNPALFEEEG